MSKNYLLGSKEEFHNFINGISKEDKIGIVTHTDLDGIASAIFLQKILESKGLSINFIEFLDHGSGALKGILKKKFDILFFTDWNVDMYLEDFKLLRKKVIVFVIDHHPIYENLKDTFNFIKTPYEYCSSHCLFDLSKDYFDTKEWQWLVCAAIIADYVWDKDEENFKLIKSVYPNVKNDSSIWVSEPGKVGNMINSSLIYYSPNLRKVYDLVLKKDLDKLKKASEIIIQETNRLISKVKKEVKYFPEEKLYFHFIVSKYNLASKVASILSDRELREGVIVFASELENKKGIIKISARGQKGDIDLGKLLKKCIREFENSSAGGHIRAAAGTFPEKYLNEFKKRLLEELKPQIR